MRSAPGTYDASEPQSFPAKPAFVLAASRRAVSEYAANVRCSAPSRRHVGAAACQIEASATAVTRPAATQRTRDDEEWRAHARTATDTTRALGRRQVPPPNPEPQPDGSAAGTAGRLRGVRRCARMAATMMTNVPSAISTSPTEKTLAKGNQPGAAQRSMRAPTCGSASLMLLLCTW